jgi:hypothetical protein
MGSWKIDIVYFLQRKYEQLRLRQFCPTAGQWRPVSRRRNRRRRADFSDTVAFLPSNRFSRPLF